MGRGNDRWMMNRKRMVVFASFRPFQQYISLQDIWRVNFGLPMWFVTRIAVAGPLKTSNSVNLEDGPFFVKML